MYDAANRHDGHALLTALRDANRALSGEDPWSAVTAVTSWRRDPRPGSLVVGDVVVLRSGCRRPVITPTWSENPDRG